MFDVIFDTGSSLTFITSAHCHDRGCKRANRYSSAESDTHESMDAEVKLLFFLGGV